MGAKLIEVEISLTIMHHSREFSQIDPRGELKRESAFSPEKVSLGKSGEFLSL